jgi:hypothetical protein
MILKGVTKSLKLENDKFTSPQDLYNDHIQMNRFHLFKVQIYLIFSGNITR